MRGMVLGFDEAKGEGVASTPGGERFSFSRLDWKSSVRPCAGLGIDFSTQEGRAIEIYALPEAAESGMGRSVKSDQAQQAFRLGGVSLACAIVGIFIPFLGFLLAIVALVVGIKAFKRGRQYNEQAGWIMGLIGSIISGITLATYLISLLFWTSVAGTIGFFL